MARNVSERQTPRKNFRIPVLQALVDIGGSVPHRDSIYPKIEEIMTFVPPYFDQMVFRNGYVKLGM